MKNKKRQPKKEFSIVAIAQIADGIYIDVRWHVYAASYE